MNIEWRLFCSECADSFASRPVRFQPARALRMRRELQTGLDSSIATAIQRLIHIQRYSRPHTANFTFTPSEVKTSFPCIAASVDHCCLVASPPFLISRKLRTPKPPSFAAMPLAILPSTSVISMPSQEPNKAACSVSDNHGFTLPLHQPAAATMSPSPCKRVRPVICPALSRLLLPSSAFSIFASASSYRYSLLCIVTHAFLSNHTFPCQSPEKVFSTSELSIRARPNYPCRRFPESTPVRTRARACDRHSQARCDTPNDPTFVPTSKTWTL